MNPARSTIASLLALASLVTPALAGAQEREPREWAPVQSYAPRETATAPSSDTRWNSPAMAITGAALAGAGVIGFSVGAVVASNDDCSEGTICFFDVSETIGTADMILGGVLFATGTALFIAGAYQIPASDPKAPPTTAQLRVGAGRADVAVTF